jgi:hypothetical protein
LAKRTLSEFLTQEQCPVCACAHSDVDCVPSGAPRIVSASCAIGDATTPSGW